MLHSTPSPVAVWLLTSVRSYEVFLLAALGLTVGWITGDSTPQQRRDAYACDITYASVNEIGFDVLRDQLVISVDDLVSPSPDVALIDEADSVLVDEALVPLVLAGTSHRETPRVEIIRLVGDLREGAEYETDADRRNVQLTDAGARKLESALGGIDLYSDEHVGSTLTEINVALHAHVLLERDVHYIVRDRAVHLINASRGRIASLQRWPDGLQAAVEAKEGLDITETGEVLDTITVQALINRYRAGRRRAAAPVLQAGRVADPAEHPECARGRGRSRLHHHRRQERRDRRAHHRGTCHRAADPGRHP